MKGILYILLFSFCFGFGQTVVKSNRKTSRVRGNNFGYRYIQSNPSPPVSNGLPNIIFDTDANNELDDQHALAYLLSNGDVFNLAALTVNATPTGGGIQNDFDEAERILQLYNLQNDVTIHIGAQGNYSTISSGFDPNNFDGIAAVDAIIAASYLPNNVIVAVGKLTNVALAILKDPTIINRTKLVWLGTNYPCDDEYNLESDVDAANYVLNSDIPMEIITVRLSCPDSGSSSVTTTVTEINAVMPGLGPLATTPITGRDGGTFSRFGDYSVDLFNNIGKETRSLFDLVALSIQKDPSWGSSSVIPAPEYIGDTWVERPSNPRTVTIWGDFDRNLIIADFFESIEFYTPITLTSSPFPVTLIEDNFDSQDPKWVLINGSTISGGTLNVTANGSVGSNSANWSAGWNHILNTQTYRTRRYKFTLDIRQTSGTGNFQLGQDNHIAFEQAVTSSWSTYTFEVNGNAVNAENDINMGGVDVGDTFEVDNFKMEIVGYTTDPNVPGQEGAVVIFNDFEPAGTTYSYEQVAPNGVNPPEINQLEVDNDDPRFTDHPSSPVTSGREGTGRALWLGDYNSPTGSEYDRNEVTAKDELLPFDEWWLGISVYPQNNLQDSRLFFQIRNLAAGGTNTVNTLSFRHDTDTDRWYVSLADNPANVDQTEATLGGWNGAGTGTSSVFFDYNFRQWNDIVIHYKAGFGAGYSGPENGPQHPTQLQTLSDLEDMFGYDPATDGFIEIWVDGTKIVDHTGTTIYRYERSGHQIRFGKTPKFGTYWGGSNTAQGDYYYDNYKVWLGSGGSYEVVDPSNQ